MVRVTATKIELNRYKIEKNASFCSGTSEVVRGTAKADMAENAIAAFAWPLVSHKQNGAIAIVTANQKSKP